MAKTTKVRRGSSARKSRTAADIPVVIPSLDELNEPPEEFLSYATCIYGEKGVGKTSLAGAIPGSLIFMFERGRRNLRVRQIPHRTKSSPGLHLVWESLGEPCTPFLPHLFAALEDDSVSHIVIDTIDRAYEACFEYICKAHFDGIEHPSEADEGHMVWDMIKRTFEATLWKILDSGKGLWLLSHAKDRKVVSRLGSSYDVVNPSCTPTAWKMIQTTCDFVFFYGFIRRRRAMRVRPDEEGKLICSNQSPDHFLSPDGDPVEILDMGDSPQESYQRLLAGFNNELYDISYDAVESASPKRRRRRKNG